MKILLAFACSILAVTVLQAKILHVPNDYALLQDAINNASNSDTVQLNSGNFVGSVSIQKPITIIGMGKDSTILNNYEAEFFSIKNTSQVIVKNLSIIQLTMNIGGSVIIIDSSNQISFVNDSISVQGLPIAVHPGSNGISISNSQYLFFLAVNIKAGIGGEGDSWASMPIIAGGNGGTGCLIDNSQNITVDSSLIAGGDGGPSYCNINGCSPSGNKGCSLSLSNYSSGVIRNSIVINTYSSDSSSSLIMTGITNVNISKIIIPQSLSLDQNYPNPFNPTTTIDFSIPHAGTVVLKVYDILGQEIYTHLNSYQESGKHSILFNGANLSSGVYIYRLIYDKYLISKRMIFVK
jgi:hypothetical protein